MATQASSSSHPTHTTTTTTTTTTSASQFPWSSLKAECLRLVVSQLLESHPGEMNAPSGGVMKAKYGLTKREEMIEFLGEVERGGVQHALQKLSDTFVTTTGNATASGSSNLKNGGVKSNKRKSVDRSVSGGEGDEDAEGETDADEEGYNTRYKGVKRVRVGEVMGDEREGGVTQTVAGNGSTTATQKKRGRPRKNAEDGPPKPRGRPRKSVTEGEGEVVSPKKRGRPRKSEEVKEKEKRPRGRPRKSVTVVDGGGIAGGSGQGEGVKQIFDGVVLKARTVVSNIQDDTIEGEVDAEGEEEDGEGDVVLPDQNELSSLGDSNKENEPNVGMMVYTPEESDALVVVENMD